ncbi:transglutaminaseTgpA domain-containing protein [Bacillus sp. 0909A]|uniref:transglutaminaseTgpA domain-containing protein n=1 Tax=Bacillus sp. 0909A TaxID=3120561 RepID=UPI002FD96531
MPLDDQKGSRLSLLLFYFLAFLLLWEWLRPLDHFTDTKHTGFFAVFIGLTFLLTFFRMRWFVTVPFCVLFTFISIHILFYEGSIFDLSWISSFLQDVYLNITFIQTGQWNDMIPSFRTLLFFVLLWLLVYLLHYWVIYQRRILFFFMMTVAYITILDTFTPYDASYAVIRIVLIGFFMLGLLYLERIKLMERITLPKAAVLKWFLPLSVLILAAVGFGLAAPKSDPKWPDPVPFLKKVTNQDRVPAGESKIGYGNHDESLGGPFQQDDTPVFTWQGKERTYFRVETKDTYTGKGWIETDTGMSYQLSGGNVENLWFDHKVSTERNTVRVKVDEHYGYNHVMYPIGAQNIKPKQAVSLEMNGNTEQITPISEQSGDIRNMGSYTVTYNSPVYKQDDLKKVKVRQNSEEYTFSDRYMQLPDTLPDRVKNLALKLTEGQDNMFDKVKAIEDYLGSNEFTYETENVTVPKDDEDYVDQFLFETKIGYCDNFSSSMVVLLRSAGIPARWVKGYTSGEYKKAGNKNGSIYEVTNNNAHSWVEVYFPEQGWVTFEPTKGFTNPAEFASSDKKDSGSESSNSPEKAKEDQKEERKQPEKEEKQKEKREPAVSKKTPSAHASVSTGWYVAIAAVLLAAVLLYVFRSLWLPVFTVRKLKRRSDQHVFFEAYGALLKQMKRRGLPKRDSETLREYAKRIDETYHSEDMLKLTANYERALYRNDDAAKLWNDSRELWENLIKRRWS